MLKILLKGRVKSVFLRDLVPGTLIENRYGLHMVLLDPDHKSTTHVKLVRLQDGCVEVWDKEAVFDLMEGELTYWPKGFKP